MKENRHWRISDFVEELNKVFDNQHVHINTVDGWFKRLEKSSIHYINRTMETKEKIYDDLDLKIAIFIKKRRGEKWALSAISRDLPNHFELRPFPVKEDKPAPHVDDIESIKKQISEEVRRTYEELAASQIEELKNQYKQLITSLPKPPSTEEKKNQSFQAMVIQRKIESSLEEEANQAWTKLPDDQRLKRIGFFRKDIDLEKKDKFVRDYINENFMDRLKKEMELDK
ncbi:MerR family transcriptional regulator [Peribacillus butanolivorans]|uniref:MerR family transcriptional regulator n=1 Tax=Peribacillus butanolivorans TaxID=421767 RepID=A0AAX0SBY2_9BACI|nr:MerR family transcriptional regulator [Peribacillus butanolivorans]PEJ38235.1 MerR family transcriptional regulator [Peribacillus butanolivorans]